MSVCFALLGVSNYGAEQLYAGPFKASKTSPIVKGSEHSGMYGASMVSCDASLCGDHVEVRSIARF